MTKALVLLSGGLDSMLAARVLMEQGVEVTGLSFKSFFFGTAKAKKVAEQLGIKLIEVDFSEEHLAMVKNPKYGYGKNMNPCIDCHALMLRKAGEIMTQPHPSPLPARLTRSGGLRKEREQCEGGRYDFVATGEVLGERPMSQNAEALKIVEKESGLTGRLIRPLSAKLLDESDLEKAGKVIRGKLLDLSGRSRKRQMELVKKYGIKEYASPGGGCLLTDPVFSEKLIKMLEYWPDCDGNDIELLKYSRTFWLEQETADKATAKKRTLRRVVEPQRTPLEEEKTQIISKVILAIGRDEKDNEQLERLAKPGDIMIDLVEEAGPTSILRIMNYPSRSRRAEAGESRIMNEMREVDIPGELKLGALKLGERKSQEEILATAMLLTGYYAVKVRGKAVKITIKCI